MGGKYTKGPWSLNKYGEPVDANGENIRAKGLALTNTDEAKANSALIAAAPELLAVSQTWRKLVEATFAPVNARAGMDELGDDAELTLTVAQFRELYEAAMSALAKAGASHV